ncbi:hypothetical protein ATANTOWER_025695, partial [Ataeniobius toweri]|nr:hypothetical protein [Ataeniobius toweri]
EKSGYCLANKNPCGRRTRTSQRRFGLNKQLCLPQPLPACPLSDSVQATHGPLKTTWFPLPQTHGSIATRIISLPFSHRLPLILTQMNPIAWSHPLLLLL